MTLRHEGPPHGKRTGSVFLYQKALYLFPFINCVCLHLYCTTPATSGGVVSFYFRKALPSPKVMSHKKWPSRKKKKLPQHNLCSVAIWALEKLPSFTQEKSQTKNTWERLLIPYNKLQIVSKDSSSPRWISNKIKLVIFIPFPKIMTQKCDKTRWWYEVC